MVRLVAHSDSYIYNYMQAKISLRTKQLTVYVYKQVYRL